MQILSFLRSAPPPVGTLLYVYEQGTQTEVQLYLDSAQVTPASQPVVLGTSDAHLYADNARVDIKLVHAIYDGGFSLIPDQVLWDVDQDLYQSSSPTFNNLTLTSVNNTVVSDTQWGYLASMDQDVNSTALPEFASLTLTARDTESRPIVTAPTVGYNTTTKTFEGYSPDTASWGSLGGVMSINQNTYVKVDETENEDHIRFYTDGIQVGYMDNLQNTVLGNLTVNNLTVQGTNDVVDWTTVAIEDNLIILNKGEVGDGVTAGYSGFIIDRGNYTDYQLVFDESAGTLKAGEAIEGDLASLSNVALWNTTPEFTGLTITDNGLLNAESTTDGHIIGKLGVDYHSGGNPQIKSIGGDYIRFESDIQFGSMGVNFHASLNKSDDLQFFHERAGDYGHAFHSEDSLGVSSRKFRIGGGDNPFAFFENCKVGIGTSTPQTELEVIGDTGVTSRVRSTNNGEGSNANIFLGLSSNETTTLGITLKATRESDGAAFDIQSSGTSMMKILKTGEIGIGTTAPKEKLHIETADGAHIVMGSASSTLRGITFANEELTTLNPAIAWSGNNLMLGRPWGGDIKFGDDAGNIHMQLVGSVGNLGIGMAPTEKLDVNGNTKADSYIMNDTNGDAFASIGVDDVAGTITFSFVPVV